MICFKFLSSLIFMLLLLCGCSFEPLYRDNEEECIKNKSCRNHITIKVNSNGYNSLKLQKILDAKKHLIEGKLPYNATLTVAVAEEFDSVGMSIDGLTTRGQGRLSVSLTLLSNDTAMPQIKTVNFDQVSSFNMDGGDSFTYDRTQSSVRERLLKVLSEQIIRETLYLVD